MPLAPAAGSSVANTRYRSASGALEIQIFVPVSRYAVGASAGPTASARVRIAAASLPAWGSVRAKAPRASPASIGGSQRSCCSGVPQVTTGSCDRMWTDRETAVAMSAAPSSSMTSVQPRYEKPAPPTDSGNGAAVRPSSPIRVNSDRSYRSASSRSMAVGRHLARGELAGGGLEQPFLLGQPPAHPAAGPAGRSGLG